MERIGSEVERSLARSGSRDAIPLAKLTAAWPSVVGTEIARRAWPLRISRDGTLHVATASATWANELAFLGEEIVERLRAELGPDAPARIRCAVGPIPEDAATPRATAEDVPGEASEVPEEVVSKAASAAAAIDDPELRELVARAARASLLKARSGRQF
jgi:hypothetical protein